MPVHYSLPLFMPLHSRTRKQILKRKTPNPNLQHLSLKNQKRLSNQDLLVIRKWKRHIATLAHQMRRKERKREMRLGSRRRLVRCLQVARIKTDPTISTKVSELMLTFLFYFILFYFILFYFILFYFILFYFILFYFILFYFNYSFIYLFILMVTLQSHFMFI